jgi:biopolymer transport protein ExbD
VEILVQADRDAVYEDVARVLSACRRAGLTEVALAAERRLGS